MMPEDEAKLPPAPSDEASAANDEKGLALAEPAPAVGEPPAPRNELEALARERDELKDQLLRRRADFENFRRRAERERSEAERDGAASLIQALLPTLDALEQAVASQVSEAPLREGLGLIHRGLLATLEAQGLRIDDPTGRRFDPQFHQALSTEEAPGVEEGTIVAVYRRGFLLGERLLRPALVKVAKAVAAEDPPERVH